MLVTKKLNGILDIVVFYHAICYLGLSFNRVEEFNFCIIRMKNFSDSSIIRIGDVCFETFAR